MSELGITFARGLLPNMLIANVHSETWQVFTSPASDNTVTSLRDGNYSEIVRTNEGVG